MSGIRTHDPSVWASEDSSCPRPRATVIGVLEFTYGNLRKLRAAETVSGWAEAVGAGVCADFRSARRIYVISNSNFP
jgi:hypothetical protein